MTQKNAIFDKIEPSIKKQGKKLFERVRKISDESSRSEIWENQIIECSMKDEYLKNQMLKFVDVFPSLKKSSQIIKHIKEYYPLKDHRMPLHLKAATAATAGGFLTAGIISSASRWSIEKMARKFIAGENIDEALSAVQSLEENGMTFTFDVLGEETTSEKQAQEYVASYINLIEGLSNSGFYTDSPGTRERINLSLKLSSLHPQFDPLAFESSVSTVLKKIRPIIESANNRNADLTIDMENFFYRNLTLEIVKELFEREIPSSMPGIGMVLQAYLRDSGQQLEDMLRWEQRDNRKLSVRLVKGAYWDYEIINSETNRWQSPVFRKKEHTDSNFEILSAILFENCDKIKPAFASHNIRSISAVIALSEELGVSRENFEFQLLYGMGDPIKKALVEMGYRVRVYAPFGKLIPGMGYLVRRILENTSNNSFLMKSFFHDEPIDELLKTPHIDTENGELQCEHDKMSKDRLKLEPLLDFSFIKNREKMSDALNEVKSETGKSFPLVIGGKRIMKRNFIVSLNPSNPEEIVGRVSQSTRADVGKAIESASKALTKWHHTPAEKRCEYILKTAELMRRERFNLAALEVLECGKPIKEADADVCEAIDYLEYYSAEMTRLSEKRILDPNPGEVNEYSYIPRGVTAIISPWNFPLAILAGMATASLVAGNTVIMKPAEQSPVIAYKFYELLEASGIPAGVVNYLPGFGSDVGEYLVKHHGIDLVAFTGSKEVGLKINKLCANTGRKQKNIKKVIAEMGGINALIIDSDADIDEAVKAVLFSAFSYQGQKCSACSRLIVLDEIYDKFIERLVESTGSLKIGPADDPAVFIGPLIDADALSKVKSFIEKGKKEARLLYETPSSLIPAKGYFAGPVIFECKDSSPLIAREEIFGPVLSLFRARNIDSAIRLANDSVFALTGGIISRSPANIEKVKSSLEAGNIYINRKITGAVVGRQPFGGYKLSGVGSKAGGPDYLLQFLIPKTVSENIMRHGYAPIKDQN